jgi:hypothetical protein
MGKGIVESGRGDGEGEHVDKVTRTVVLQTNGNRKGRGGAKRKCRTNAKGIGE